METKFRVAAGKITPCAGTHLTQVPPAKAPPVPAPISLKCHRQKHPTADGAPLLDTGTAMDIRTGILPALPVQQIRRCTTGSHAGSLNSGGALAQLQTLGISPTTNLGH
ncbi:hypothetical protein [Kamptonema formosum]|uniref:hypothetical protein n=1 Tax=Kamptonema formosum TaxID=331992 RepID=UPI00036C9BA5|nr:hypothetical protein [Oscillatoria sp. PCC 10802]